ncbi:MAG TPA: iron uptake transporter deferrochelatase/peroxidase subunit [Acidimicrobiales bacterium]|jgi:deferrochelatase/peroxidase EfeB|nr:iron uptake transporter deferrochelatase/peroxidase subunit [Acidimicrobiales bacterium]
MGPRSGISRRRLLQAGAVAGTAVLAGLGGAVVVDASRTGEDRPDPPGWTSVAFHGAHQAGVLAPVGPSMAVVAFDVVAESHDELRQLFRVLTDRARLLTAGGLPLDAGPAAPPDDNGILGPTMPVRQLAVTIGVGASLFDSRFGLAARKPARLKPMTSFPNDNLDPARTQGDLSVVLQAADGDTVIHALRDLTKHTRGAMQPRWRINGSVSRPRPSGTPRNYLGFKDGIANPDLQDPATVRSLIWVPPGGPEPAWTTGGTYQVVRIIRMLVEFWDRIGLQEQETLIGRRKDSGAPLDGNRETDIPDYQRDPTGAVIPLSAHIRLANPRTESTASSQILRRGFNYDLGLDDNGNLDQGLLFTCYQQDIARQFETVQARLINEPLVDYISPVGGGYFFVLPGVTGLDDYYGRRLLA